MRNSSCLSPLPLPPLLLPSLLPLLLWRRRCAGLGLRWHWVGTEVPALGAQHALLPTCENRHRRPLIRQPAAEPAAAGVCGAVHPDVEPQQLAAAEEAGRGSGQSAIGCAPPHSNVAAQLAPHPGDELVGGYPCLAALPYVRL